MGLGKLLQIQEKAKELIQNAPLNENKPGNGLTRLLEIQRKVKEAIKNAPPPYENEKLEPFLTPKEVAKRLKVSYGTVIYWIKTGKLRAIKIGGRYRISHLWLKQFAGKEAVSDYLP